MQLNEARKCLQPGHGTTQHPRCPFNSHGRSNREGLFSATGCPHNNTETARLFHCFSHEQKISPRKCPDNKDSFCLTYAVFWGAFMYVCNGIIKSQDRNTSVFNAPSDKLFFLSVFSLSHTITFIHKAIMYKIITRP